jgi:hypothetical protein
MRDRQRLENHRLDQAEDGSVGSDAESKREDCYGAEGGTFAQGAEGIAKVLKNCIEHNKESMTHFGRQDLL